MCLALCLPDLEYRQDWPLHCLICFLEIAAQPQIILPFEPS